MIIITSFMVLLFLFTDNLKLKNFRIILFYFFSLCFSVLVYFRPEYMLNTDYKEYYNYFKWINFDNIYNLSDTIGFEYGFGYIVTLIKYFFESERACFSGIAFLSVFISYKAILRLNPKTTAFSFSLFLLSFCVYIFLGQIRQGISLSLGLLAISYLLEDKRKQFLLTVIIASSIHVTALILILAPFVKYFRIKYIFYSLLLSFAFVFIDVIKPLIITLAQFIPFGSFITGKIIAYGNSEFSTKVGFSFIQVYYVLLSTVLYILVKKYEYKNNYILTLCKIFMVGVILNFTFNSFSVLLRLTYYYLALDCILMGYLLNMAKNGYTKILIYCPTLMLFILRFYMQWSEHING
ncbi:O169/O183 family O-antigen polymerase [Shigella boydii]|uniref:O-antigen polymerase n=3 Tax=Shigella boydii TaxID=621 RepID=Q93CS5_SHIBO|nr:O169/O183 family O-antigen polymerase [Shigella boydii]MEB5809078.1 O169/O183 family O-antigen polymerase [Escherichia coli]AAL27339.1 O-antigen polymerase [Shigella boydii]AAW29815.1 Wzy [Shigella boydii]EAA5160218.1 O169 family O-antigen polymerase [Shigella boydii]EFW7714132.1 O169 family O-antigen polymerase [Shigella boydii]